MGVKSELQIDEILVYNSMGIQVIRLNVGDKQLILDLSQYDKGIYYLRMKMGEQFQTHKLILL
ncbi:MAG: T9SS type A sorting domain-containing protein [Bacteroidales bacterium]|nr:T9SS type A sorting domain-containing protein [Bacteroidales bacterium]